MEDNSGYRRVFTVGSVYRTAQWAIGANRMMRVFANQHVRCTASDIVVDIGCGTGEMRSHLNPARYIGIEPNASYVDKSAASIGPSDEIVSAGVEDDGLRSRLPDQVDLVLMVGVLHHLDDDVACKAMQLAADLVRPGGRFVSIDPVLVDGQRRISHNLVKRDRGRNVRNAEQLRSVIAPSFPHVNITLRGDLLRLPYDHAIVEAFI